MTADKSYPERRSWRHVHPGDRARFQQRLCSRLADVEYDGTLLDQMNDSRSYMLVRIAAGVNPDLLSIRLQRIDFDTFVVRLRIRTASGDHRHQFPWQDLLIHAKQDCRNADIDFIQSRQTLLDIWERSIPLLSRNQLSEKYPGITIHRNAQSRHYTTERMIDIARTGEIKLRFSCEAHGQAKEFVGVVHPMMPTPASTSFCHVCRHMPPPPKRPRGRR